MQSTKRGMQIEIRDPWISLLLLVEDDVVFGDDEMSRLILSLNFKKLISAVSNVMKSHQI